jgi:FlaA1/EpsC-like NDP-sugar epimerase
MIRFYGYEPHVDIKIETIGLRAGERLDESLWSADESPCGTRFSKILKVERRKQSRFQKDVFTLFEKLKPVCAFDAACPDAYRNAALINELLGLN